jgi:probable F420-dependent oxidoreductase
MPPHPFRFGVINETMSAPRPWLEGARRAEALGYSTFLLRDHFVPDYFGDQYAPLVALMAAASATTTLRVGTMVLGNDYRHPALLAKEAATLDVLSGGRFELGVGAGWLRAEYEQAGIPFDPNGTRVSRLEEALRVIKGVWSGEPLHHEGAHYRVAGLAGVPRPAQRPHPPILVGGGHRRMLTIAGREAQSVGLLTSSVASGALVVDPRQMLPEAVEEKLGWVREGAGARWRDIELSLIPSLIVADDRRSATERLIAGRGWSGITAEQVWSMPSVLVGSAEQIETDLLERRERYGFSYYVVSDADAERFAPVVTRLAGA